MSRNIFNTYSFEQLVNIYYPEEDADAFLNNWHKGAFAKAVLGDESKFVDPSALAGEELEKARTYFIDLCLKREMAPA